MRIALIIPILLVTMIPALAQVTTNDNSYVEGDTIVISGQVPTIIEGEIITLQIFHKGNVVDITQFDDPEDGSFTHTVLAEGPLWTNEGDYLIRAYYGEETYETQFSLGINNESLVPQVQEFNSDVTVTTSSNTVEKLTTQSDIPEWVRGVFVFWADDQISDDDLINAITFLVDTGIIQLNNSQ